MNNSDNSYKSIFKNYIFLIALCLFVVIYIIINLDIVRRGDIYNGDLTKSILLTAIIILLIYLFVTWDGDEDEDENQDSNIVYNEPVKIGKFNLGSISQPIVPIGNIPINTGVTQNIPSNMPSIQTVKTVQTIQTIPTSVPVSKGIQNQDIPIQSNNKIQGESKYFIVNQTNPIRNSNPLLNFTNARRSIINNNYNNSGNFDNPNIFIAQKNIGKYGIKF